MGGALHLAKQHCDVALVAQDVPDRRRDVALGENPRCHLVQQRLEEMVVVAVDDGHVHGGVSQSPGREQTTEAAAHDRDTMTAGFRAVAHRACREFDVVHADAPSIRVSHYTGQPNADPLDEGIETKVSIFDQRSAKSLTIELSASSPL